MVIMAVMVIIRAIEKMCTGGENSNFYDSILFAIMIKNCSSDYNGLSG